MALFLMINLFQLYVLHIHVHLYERCPFEAFVSGYQIRVHTQLVSIIKLLYNIIMYYTLVIVCSHRLMGWQFLEGLDTETSQFPPPESCWLTRTPSRNCLSHGLRYLR